MKSNSFLAFRPFIFLLLRIRTWEKGVKVHVPLFIRGSIAALAFAIYDGRWFGSRRRNKPQ